VVNKITTKFIWINLSIIFLSFTNCLVFNKFMVSMMIISIYIAVVGCRYVLYVCMLSIPCIFL